MEKSKKKKSSTEIRLVNLAPDDIRRLPRPHKGFDQLVGPLIEFYKANESALRIDGLDTDFILDALAQYQQLLEPLQKAAKQLQLVQETRLLHASNAWSGFLEIYARAVVVGRVNKDVARGIAEFAHFMKTGPRKKKTAPPVAA